jgi:uncharacterized protein
MKYGFAPLGPAEGAVKTAIFSGNNARLYGIDAKVAAMHASGDQFAAMKSEYEKNGAEPSNLRYVYVKQTLPPPHA